MGGPQFGFGAGQGTYGEKGTTLKPLAKGNIVKKYKKICRRTGVSKRLGESQVVPQDEYQANFLFMIEQCNDRTIIIPETIPNHETYRNEALQRYNSELKKIADTKPNCHLVSLFDDFLPHFSDFYLDIGHPNDLGYDYIADKILGYIHLHHLDNQP